ncbi:MAG: hypothetical protein R3F55_22465 [Alphaproteobacteria bacterium]
MPANKQGFAPALAAVLLAGFAGGWPAAAWAQDDHGSGHESGGSHESGGGGHAGGGGGGGHAGGGGGGHGEDGHEEGGEHEGGPGGNRPGGAGVGGPGFGRGDATGALEDLLRGGGRGGLHGDDEGDSDRPIWAQGNRDLNPHAQGGGRPAGAGVGRGDLYGDLYVVLRDANGVPILLTLPSGEQVAQPLDASGNLIPLDDEGAPIDSALVQEVEFGRLSSARSPAQVFDHALAEAYGTLASVYTLDADHNIVVADGASIGYDAAGRLVVTVAGESRTIDSPLANQALYADLLATGALDTVVTFAYVDDNDETVFVSKQVSFVPTRDFDVAAALLAGAADKTGTITVDLVAYQNSILDVNTVVDGRTVAWYDYSAYAYDRAAAYAGETLTYLEASTTSGGDVVYTAVTRPLLDAVFGGADGVFDPASENAAGTNIAGFATASNDALRVIEFVHDHQVPGS